MNVSGGRTSAYMLRKILDRHGGKLPDYAVATFANTGKEYPQTLDFVRDLEARWQVPIVWIEYWRNEDARGVKGDPKNTYRVVDFETASRNGEPFMELIVAKQQLPNVFQRFCTSHLKVMAIDLYVRKELKWKRKKIINVLGMRFDEKQRLAKGLLEECMIKYPLAAAGVDENTVIEFWKAQDFDLQLPGYKSNCDLCYLKGEKIIGRILREEPERAEWWIEEERKKKHTFRKQRSFETSLGYARSELFPPEATDERKVDCFCGD